MGLDVLVLGASTSWDLRTFLENSFSTLNDWFRLAVMILGLVAIGVAVWMITTGLMSNGKKQTNWGIAVVLLLVGGTLSMTTGFEFVREIASGGRKTIEDLGTGVIHLLPYLKSFW